jgi:hypothetical protein
VPVLQVLLSGPRLGALTITEINPHHGEPGGATLQAFLNQLIRGPTPECPQPPG